MENNSDREITGIILKNKVGFKKAYMPTLNPYRVVYQHDRQCMLLAEPTLSLH